tara:strand:- start:206 stop:688 length:483 start_codon:yes stop_codon:yes gene_type:complete
MTLVKNIKNNLHDLLDIRFNKIYILLFSMLFFSFIYMLLEDDNFEGVNKFKEIVKEEVIKKKVQKEIKENFINLENYQNSFVDKEEVIDQATKETEDVVKAEELRPEKVQPSEFDKYFNRLYFAIITGCLLGYGDIYPVSNIAKFIAGVQGLITVSLIVY